MKWRKRSLDRSRKRYLWASIGLIGAVEREEREESLGGFINERMQGLGIGRMGMGRKML